MAGAVIAVVVEEKLEIWHVAEKTRGLDHLQTLLHGGLLCHLHHEAHEVSHIIRLAHFHTSMT